MEQSLNTYKNQLFQVNEALNGNPSESDRESLLDLKSNLEQLIELTEENVTATDLRNGNDTNTTIDDEYSLFMEEMSKDGALASNTSDTNIQDELESLQGMKCQAPYEHMYGEVSYYNAMVASVLESETKNFAEIKVLVFFTNPIHKGMLPCPYYLDGHCNFSDEKCRFSHGEIVALSSLKDFKDPDFTSLRTNSRILAKQKDNLWHRAVIKSIKADLCCIKFEDSQQEIECDLKDVFPLEGEDGDSSSSDSSGEDEDEVYTADIVEANWFNLPVSGALGEWEKHTKGIGSKLMQKMGYVLGTGLGKNCEGRLNPVNAQILPAGKSLDYCMNLRERANGDENLFSVERRLKKQKKLQDMRNKTVYENAKRKTDVFQFINDTLSNDIRKPPSASKKQHRQDIKAGSNRDLNVAKFKIEEEIKRVEVSIVKCKQALERHRDESSAMHKKYNGELQGCQRELKSLHDSLQNVKNEQNIRSDKKKLTIF